MSRQVHTQWSLYGGNLRWFSVNPKAPRLFLFSFRVVRLSGSRYQNEKRASLKPTCAYSRSPWQPVCWVNFWRDEPVFGSVVKSRLNRWLSIEIVVSHRLVPPSVINIIDLHLASALIYTTFWHYVSAMTSNIIPITNAPVSSFVACFCEGI